MNQPPPPRCFISILHHYFVRIVFRFQSSTTLPPPLRPLLRDPRYEYHHGSVVVRSLYSMTSSTGKPSILRTVVQRCVHWLGPILMTTLPESFTRSTQLERRPPGRPDHAAGGSFNSFVFLFNKIEKRHRLYNRCKLINCSLL